GCNPIIASSACLLFAGWWRQSVARLKLRPVEPKSRAADWPVSRSVGLLASWPTTWRQLNSTQLNSTTLNSIPAAPRLICCHSQVASAAVAATSRMDNEPRH
ncbi:hypothetical protein ACMBCN_03085, partial [Candidatus Liberibacter asiaticus]